MSTENSQHRVGYILRRFPSISETFVLNEILAQETLGQRVQVFSLLPPNDSRYHGALEKLDARIFYVPIRLKPLLLGAKVRAKANRSRFFKTLLYVITQRKPGLLLHFLQACYIANRAPHLRIRHLHAHFSNENATVALLASMLGDIPFSFTGHAFDLYTKKYSGVSERKFLSQKISEARFVATISEYNKQLLESVSPADNDKIKLIHNGIDLTRFTPNPTPRKGIFTISCVARLVEKKGIPTLIEACRIMQEWEVPFRCQIVGGGYLHNRLSEMIREYNLQDRVVLAGPLTHSRVLNQYRQSHLFVLPCIVDSNGNRDGLPVSLVEALACGLPVISTPVTGIPEVVKDGYNGLMVPENDPEALATAIRSVIDNPELYNQLRTNARASVESTFDIQQTSALLNALFQGSLA